jgi:uncharacterized damage-inducible protein DinB
MNYDFLVGTYGTERLKVLSVWSMFQDEDMEVRPHPTDKRGRSVREQMIHQCMSEDLWFRVFFDIDVGISTIPGQETRLDFIRTYAASSEKRFALLVSQIGEWWEQEIDFFKIARSRAWIMVRRIAHTAHHRGQQTTMLRMLNRGIYSTYGPSADSGGLAKDGAPTIYAYRDVDSLITGEAAGGMKRTLPKAPNQAVTERPG